MIVDTSAVIAVLLDEPERDRFTAVLSDRFAGYVTGTTVVVDGGLGLHNWIEPRD